MFRILFITIAISFLMGCDSDKPLDQYSYEVDIDLLFEGKDLKIKEYGECFQYIHYIKGDWRKESKVWTGGTLSIAKILPNKEAIVVHLPRVCDRKQKKLLKIPDDYIPAITHIPNVEKITSFYVYTAFRNQQSNSPLKVRSFAINPLKIFEDKILMSEEEQKLASLFRRSIAKGSSRYTKEIKNKNRWKYVAITAYIYPEEIWEKDTELKQYLGKFVETTALPLDKGLEKIAIKIDKLQYVGSYIDEWGVEMESQSGINHRAAFSVPVLKGENGWSVDRSKKGNYYFRYTENNYRRYIKNIQIEYKGLEFNIKDRPIIFDADTRELVIFVKSDVTT